MSQWAGGVLTAAGRALQAKVEAGTTALVLTKIKLGDGTESMDAVDNLTDLVGAKAVLGISASVADGDHATITGVVLSTQLQAGFWAREWGLFATDPDEGEILYMITIDAQPEWLPASTAAAQVSATYAMNIAVANATNIEVQIDPAGLVDVEMLQSYMGLAKRSTACALGDTAMLENLPAMYFLECTTAGTTGATAPVITPPVTEGQTITDGTVVWTVRKCFPTSGGAATERVFLYRNVNTGDLVVCGGKDVKSGAHLQVLGKDNSAAAGYFNLFANDGSNTKVLQGRPSGYLSWDGNEVLTTANGLPLSGGFITGTYVGRSVDNDALVLMGGKEYWNSSKVALFGKDATEHTGMVEIQIPTGNKQHRSTHFMLDGSIICHPASVNGADANISDNAVLAKSIGTNGYVKAVSGEIRQWGQTNDDGWTSEGTTYYKYIDFPLTYNATPSVALTPMRTTGVPVTTHITVADFSTAGVTIHATNPCYVRWLAIGY